MKIQIFEYVTAVLDRGKARRQRQWHRIRRLGWWRFVTLLIAGFWLLMVVHFFVSAWMISPSLDALDRLPPRFYRRLLFMVPAVTIALCVGAAYSWRVNERKYPNDRNA